MIKNLTPRLPEMGGIRAGTKGEEVVSGDGKRWRLPKRLNHYLITTPERDEKGTLILDTELMDSLKKSDKAIVDANGNLTGIPIRLLYNDISLNFPTRYACYTGNKCVCSGDGEKANTRDGREVKCPCKQLEPTYEGKDKCRVNGRLTCIIDGALMFGGCYVLRTTSINTVKQILGSLLLYHTATSGMLSFIPFILVLKPMTTTIPTTGQLTTVYVSSILYNGNPLGLKKEALFIAKEHSQLLVEMKQVEASARQLIKYEVESEQEQADIQQEFYPDAIDIPAEQKPEPDAPTIHRMSKPENVETRTKPDSNGFEGFKPPAEPEPEQEPEKEPEKKPEDVKPETTEPEKPAEQKPEETPPVLITKNQKRQIVSLKKKNKISNPEVWAKLLEPFEVKTANALTEIQANEFICTLDDIPF